MLFDCAAWHVQVVATTAAKAPLRIAVISPSTSRCDPRGDLLILGSWVPVALGDAPIARHRQCRFSSQGPLAVAAFALTAGGEPHRLSCSKITQRRHGRSIATRTTVRAMVVAGVHRRRSPWSWLSDTTATSCQTYCGAIIVLSSDWPDNDRCCRSRISGQAWAHGTQRAGATARAQRPSIG